MRSARPILRVLAVSFLACIATAQGTRSGPGVGREQMWPAPTAEDWKKPVLITFQRSWKDAVAVSKETGKPILICINMDGEIASEHFAGIRYREKEIAKLYSPYVCVIASTYRHTPRDYDDNGRRILCPRFGSVTCGEHIAIEPFLFKKFMKGQRIAPRHIALDLDGNEVYDVFFRNDTASVFADIRDRRPRGRPSTVVRGDRPLVERVGSRDIADRTAVEKAYVNGDKALRQKLLDAALKNKDADPIDLLRLAIFGLDVNLSKQARGALAETSNPAAAALVSDAMRVPMDEKERAKLIATLQRLGKDSPIARWLAGVHKGLGGESERLDVKGWAEPKGATLSRTARRGVYSAPVQTSDVESKALAAAEKPKDPTSRLELAETTLAFAMKAGRIYKSNPRMAKFAARHLFTDAQKFAREAQALGAKGWRLDSVLALSHYYGGKRDEAYPFAERAVKAIPPGDTSWSSMAVVTVFAESRWMTIKKAVREGKDWPKGYLTDLHAAYSLLLKHPLGTDKQVLWHYDLLVFVRAYARSGEVLRQGIARFRSSALLHQKYRERLLRWRGPTGTERAYKDLLDKHKDPATLAPYAGIATVAAAHQLRRRRQYDRAIETYGRAIGHYEAAIEADARNKPFCDHAIALALAGQARVYYQIGEDGKALDAIVASFARSARSAGTRDGMNVTPGETAQMLLSRLRKTGKAIEAQRLAKALSTIDPKLLRPDIGLGPK